MRTRSVIGLAASSWVLSGKTKPVAEIHAVHARAAYSATILMVAI